MSTRKWDEGMQPAVRLCIADCEEINLGHASDLIWTLLTFNAAQPYLPVLPIVWLPYPSLAQHGVIRWVITGTYAQTAVATTMRVRPITRGSLGANQALAAGSNNMDFATGSAAIAGGFFMLTVEMAVVGNNKASAQQVWSAHLKVVSSAGAILFDVDAGGLSTIDPFFDNNGQDLGLYLSFAAGAPTIVVKSIVATHTGQRNGS